jgi:diadenosine tetraphosphatase ApaH/serine/threonine PP2A family protein phosphatase
VPALFALTATGKLAAHRPPDDMAMPLFAPRQWLAVMGAVGQPRDGKAAACYGLLDTAASEISWMRVPYDVAAAAAKIRAAGLPERLAARLATGS